MNARIEKLAQRALIYANKTWDPESDANIFVKIAMEKHAELIVKECAKIADDGYGSDHFGNGIAGYQLLKHFGVQE